VPRFSVATPVGHARVDLDKADGPLLLVIGHGAGGTVDAPDLVAVRRHCLAVGISVARVTQPYRVAGRKAPPTAATLDAAWAAVLAALSRRKALAGLRYCYAGRSSGARVACRTAADDSVQPRPIAVVALAFPVHPPGRPESLRTPELDAVPVPVLVVQGDRDPFGMPAHHAGREVVPVPGDHSLKSVSDQTGVIVASWLHRLS
jgi:predicted alpha/beta-hydrolase family hydrolase